jgi:hypothetical protein
MLKCATDVPVAADPLLPRLAESVTALCSQGPVRGLVVAVMVCAWLVACGGGEPDFESCTTLRAQTVCCKTWLSGSGNKARTVCD